MYVNDFIPSSIASTMFERLWTELNWERRPDAPRREYWTNHFNRDYTYGRGAGIRTYKAQPNHYWIGEVDIMLREKYCHYLEGCFLNGYEGARDWLGWHSDDDPGIDHDKPIAIVTLYSDPSKQPRVIQFRDNATQTIESLALEHGSLYLMPPGFQDTHQHRIPKAGFDCADRISLTFRGLV